MKYNLRYVVIVILDACWTLFQCLESDIKQAIGDCKDLLSILLKILLLDIPFYLIFGNRLDWEKNSYSELYIILKKWSLDVIDEVIFTPIRPHYYRAEDVYWTYCQMEMSWYVDDDWTKCREHLVKEDVPYIKDFLRDEWETIKEYIRLLPSFIWSQIKRGLRRLFILVFLLSLKIFGNGFIIICDLLLNHTFFFVTRGAFISLSFIIFVVVFQIILLLLNIIFLSVYLFILGTPFFFIYKFLRQRPFFATHTRYRDMPINPFPDPNKSLVTVIGQFLFMLKDRYVVRSQRKKEQLHLVTKRRYEKERNARVVLGLPLDKDTLKKNQ